MSNPTLFNARLLAQHTPKDPTPAEHKQLLHAWAQTIRDGSIRQKANKEAAIRSAFIQNFFVKILGYVPFGSHGAQTLREEQHTGAGSADAALGQFSAGQNQVVAPVELKGADTPNLDAIMPGRHKSPVQQAWEYAADTPGRSFIVLSNMLEIRLYSYAHTRQVYERFDILTLADSDAEYQRFRLLLGADNLLSGRTAQLLAQSAAAEQAITQQLYHDYKNWRLDLILSLGQHNALPLSELITHAQTLLDRLLFIAFAEDRGLLPAKTIEHAYRQRDPYNPRPIWDNFQGLFRAIDKGNAHLGIPAYNGGLFRLDTRLDQLTVPDAACDIFKRLGDYDFASEVDVAVLGHIFEQSVADLEELRELPDLAALQQHALAATSATRGVSGKRKQHGIVYTPDHITAFIVEQTLGSYLNDQREAVRVGYVDGETFREKANKTDRDRAKTRGIGKLREPARLTELLFWHHWRDTLQNLKIVDPACGSGAFLIAAFDTLKAEYQQIHEQITQISGMADLFDIHVEILSHNLYGVDLNPESIEISKLSLWLKTAQHGKPLQSLENNLRVGNSLITEINGGSEFSERAFDWYGAFPDVFAAGGFDIVLGNPPYVRMERLKPIKPYLERHYAVASDRADLYCYFFELGVRLLKTGGRLGYISSSTFFKTGSGAALRRYLLEKTQLRSIVDFGDLQVFEGVTTYPAIIVLEKNAAVPRCRADKHSASANADEWQDGGCATLIHPTKIHDLIRFLALTEAPSSLSEYFQQHAQTMPQSQLGADSWQLQSATAAALRQKLTQGHPTLKQVYGAPCRGVVTGLNEAFVINRATRDALIAQDPRSADLLKPFLEGKDLKKWRIEPQDLYLIYIPKGVLDIADYPAIQAHLQPFKTALEKRATKQQWFELQQAQAAYVPAFEGGKIIYGHFSPSALFSADSKGFYSNDKSYIIPSSDHFLLGILNSRAIWWLIAAMCPFVRGGFYEVRVQYIETLSIPAASAAAQAQLANLAQQCQQAAEARRDCQTAFRHRIGDLCPHPLPKGEGTKTTLPKLPSPTGESAARGAKLVGGEGVKLTTKLNHWWGLDFAAFRAEAKKLFKQDIPLAERNDWEAYFNQQRALVQHHSAQIAQLERALNQHVYALFHLTPAEIALIEEKA